ncbi:protein SERAC1 isoform X1 [Diorhabda sublineata]|uniref:protein SERAC1 isoform X1 n=1 Tax=Diorhabda sublineata TaxID=1163346 RepID=UPI0024E066E7|nr:protein SERAC1 isoform X1 [Diorhabda sublineata]
MKHTIFYPKFWKYISLVIVGSSSGWVYYQIKKTREILENTVDTSVLYMKNIQSEEENKHEEFINLHQSSFEKYNIFKNTLDSLRFSYARRLVQLANNENNTDYRIKAVRHLIKIRHLDSWHFSLLANMIDAKTAIGLARSGDADKRLFMEPPLRYHNYNRDMLINAMRDFLIQLYEKSNHPCLGYFLSEVFVYEHYMDYIEQKNNVHIVDNDSSALELSKFIQSESDILPKCLESLVHHCCIEKYTKHIIEQNGLPLLMEIYQRYKNNTDIIIKICQILSYMSVDRSVLDSLHKSGWIGILSEWMHHSDVRIAIPAAQALFNLDSDNDVVFSKRLYLLHPVTRTAKDQDMDVVFVHGLLGGVFYTWRQRLDQDLHVSILNNQRKMAPYKTDEKNDSVCKKSIIERLSSITILNDLKSHIENKPDENDYELVWDDIPTNTNDCASGPYSVSTKDYDVKEDKVCKLYTHCWPRDWLPEDIQNLRIIGVNYNTTLSMWTAICPSAKGKLTLDERSLDLMTKLVQAGLGTKPIVWVTHSMGGLIVKNILCKSFESQMPAIRNLCLNTKGVIFYSTPHNGSRLANLNQATALLLWPSVEVQELREHSPQLKKIHKRFLDIVSSIPMKIVTFVETKATVVTAMRFNFLLVQPDSGYPGVGEYFEIPQDHLGICKPLTKYSFLYQKVVHTLRQILEENSLNSSPTSEQEDRRIIYNQKDCTCDIEE